MLDPGEVLMNQWVGKERAGMTDLKDACTYWYN